ncbi:MAG: secondary thiamine-phosphate synthase enzyme YjbQ [Candidatus Marinimicrobia bacterium]|nr:secondary thiamine-phosphate synthase enzyme YjbQ [Candidatus Neomarinimicrobiota bacterium]MCF7851332.1 secondary thiamine-phosphate synthase enzyme YjbQ [Candidatus Neomarinimicrobiota bacterium]MCF7904323.1 secondary thiamine-phosphate synthase enzyme YjbQ [Candidatus Neomarinimicrobiota bacterium]
MLFTKAVSTTSHSQFVNVTALVKEALQESGVESGVATVFVSHTTAGITINENADPDVTRDLLYILDEKIPWNDPEYRHYEGNTAAHMKASMMGNSSQVIIENGQLVLGTWQGIYFCEFDGPRQRKLLIKISA